VSYRRGNRVMMQTLNIRADALIQAERFSYEAGNTGIGHGKLVMPAA
jgi:hypothetical protein